MGAAPIGIFDSGYGGLTVMREIVKTLPEFDYLYLGDNARTPYGTRSFESIYAYTLECVEYLFAQGCPLVILACNTASARALRSIQQYDLPNMPQDGRRVLGIIRPTAEIIGDYTQTKEIGIFATSGTVASHSYEIETHKMFPDVKVHQEACPMWVPLVENDETDNEGAHYFVRKKVEALFEKSANIDTILLACTHYPLLMPLIQQYVPLNVKVLSQGKIVASSLKEYMERHPVMAEKCTKGGVATFLTTDSTESFERHGTKFYGQKITASRVHL